MDYREEYDAEIDLKDLLLYILRRWRSILLTGLLFCALLSAYKAVHNAGLSPEELIPQKIKDYEFELSQYKLDRAACESGLQSYSARLERQRLYMEKSVLMQIDPYYKPAASADVFVKLNSTEWEGLPANLGLDPTDSILKAYTSNFSDALDWREIEELTDNEKIYLEELLNVSVDHSSNTFTVTVVYSDGQTAQEILDIVLKQEFDKQTGIAAGVGEHTAMVSNRSLAYSIDSSLANRQSNNGSIVAGYEQSILDQRIKLEQMEEPKKPLVIGFIKYPAVGFVLGFFLMAAFYGASYLIGGKLHGERSLQDRYGYALLGVLPRSQKKRLLSGIDRLLEKLVHVPAEPEEEVYWRIALNLASMADEQWWILLTGTVSFERLQALAEALSQLLVGINLVAAADISLNASTLETLAGCNAVLLVEEEGKSRISRIRKERDCIAALGKQVIGYVLL